MKTPLEGPLASKSIGCALPARNPEALSLRAESESRSPSSETHGPRGQAGSPLPLISYREPDGENAAQPRLFDGRVGSMC